MVTVRVTACCIRTTPQGLTRLECRRTLFVPLGFLVGLHGCRHWLYPISPMRSLSLCRLAIQKRGTFNVKTFLAVHMPIASSRQGTPCHRTAVQCTSMHEAHADTKYRRAKSLSKQPRIAAWRGEPLSRRRCGPLDRLSEISSSVACPVLLH